MLIALLAPIGAFDHQQAHSSTCFSSFCLVHKAHCIVSLGSSASLVSERSNVQKHPCCILTSWWVIGTGGAKIAVVGGEEAEVGEQVLHPVPVHLHPLHPAVQTLQPATWRGLTDGTEEEKV